jgi:hypothetical protein
MSPVRGLCEKSRCHFPNHDIIRITFFEVARFKVKSILVASKSLAVAR